MSTPGQAAGPGDQRMRLALAITLTVFMATDAAVYAATPPADCKPTLAVVDVLSFRDCRTVEVREVAGSSHAEENKTATRFIELPGIKCFTNPCPISLLTTVQPLNPFWLLGFCGEGGTDLVFTVPGSSPGSMAESSSNSSLRSLSLELVSDGLALARDDAYEAYKAAEANAREQRRGCWAPVGPPSW